MLGLGWTNARIARGLRITGKTLAKHYFREIRQRDEARPALEAEHAMMIYAAAQGGNVGAMKEMGRVIEKLDLALPQPPKAQPTRPEKLGKKAAAEKAAQEVGEDSVWGRSGSLVGY